MKKKAGILLLIILFQIMGVLPVRAAFENKEIGSAYLGRGGSGVAALNSAFLLYENPAALYFGPVRQVDVFFKNYYGISSLNQIAAAVSFTLLGVPVGLGFWQYGDKLYHESALRLSAAWGVGKNFSLALQGDVLNLWIKNYGSATTAAVGLAVLYRLSDQINVALRTENLNRPAIGQAGEALPLQMVSGLSYQALPPLAVFADVVKESGQPFDYRFGVEYQSSRWLAVRGGFRVLTNSYAAGLSFYTGRVRMDYGFEYHPQLNFSHSLSVGYAF